MKLYTKTGDDGSTGLLGGQRVSKDSFRVQVCGTVDELNSMVGLTAVACRFEEIESILRTLQNRLFELGADLATPIAPDKNATHKPHIGPEQVQEAEQIIDRVCEPTEPLSHFVLPGGSELAARLHLARAVCRRTERLCVALAKAEPVGEHVVSYLNRMSDLLFALARRANQLEGVKDVPWQAGE